jgi:hypothetical protein
MKTISNALILLSLLAAPAAASSITLFNGGVVTGAPGDPVGWGFTIRNDSGDWMVITGVWVAGPSDTPPSPTESSPVGPGGASAFADYASLNGGPVDWAIPATDGSHPYYDWTDFFSVSAETGLGAYPIDPGIGPGVQDSGYFYVQYQLYDDDPMTVGNPVGGLQELLTLSSTRPSFEIDVEVPEPGPAVLMGIGLFLILFSRIIPGRRTIPMPWFAARARKDISR